MPRANVSFGRLMWYLVCLLIAIPLLDVSNGFLWLCKRRSINTLNRIVLFSFGWRLREYAGKLVKGIPDDIA